MMQLADYDKILTFDNISGYKNQTILVKRGNVHSPKSMTCFQGDLKKEDIDQLRKWFKDRSIISVIHRDHSIMPHDVQIRHLTSEFIGTNYRVDIEVLAV